MNTAFGKFVSGKFFDKLFLLFLLAGTVFMACAKGSAVRAAGAAGTALLSIVVVAWGYLHAKNIKSVSYSLDLGLGNKDYHILLIRRYPPGGLCEKRAGPADR